MPRFRAGLGAAVLIGLFAAAPAGAATITVTTTTDELTAGAGCSLREAIATVNGNGNGDCGTADAGGNTIVMKGTTYLLTLEHFLFLGGPPTGCISTSSPRPSDNSWGELSVAGTVHNLTIKGAGPGRTVLDACKLGDRALQVMAGAGVTLKDLTITNGHAQDGTDGTAGSTYGSVGGAANPGAGGGAILNQGILSVIDSSITNSHAGDGGMGGTGGDLGGTGGLGGAGGSGGGIASTGTLTVTDSTIAGNGAGNGGAAGTATLGSTANGQSGNGGSGNSGGNGGGGGGIENVAGTATITGSTITGNTTGNGGAGTSGQNSDSSQGNGGNGGNGGSGGNGAGIASAGSIIQNASLRALNDTVVGNLTGNGAAAGNPGGSANDLFTAGQGGTGGNGGYGGGIINLFRSTAQFVNLTIAQNASGRGGTGGGASANFPAGANGTSGHGGGIYATSSSPTLQNTILFKNGTGGDCRGTITDGGHNLILSASTLGGIVTDPCNVSGFATGDPKLEALADNGGPTQTMRLQSGSAAIDQVPAHGAGCPATDQRGVIRPGGAACDIGAYEAAAPGATTGPASQISRSAATIAGTVVANAAAATVQFQYGRSKSYGSSTRQQTTSGVAPASVMAHLLSLTPGATYHYRVVARSGDGTTFGADRTFMTGSGSGSGSGSGPGRPGSGGSGGSGAGQRLTRLEITPTRVHRRRGATVSYFVSGRSETRFVLSRCIKMVKKRCTRYRRVSRFTRHDAAGRHSFHLGVKRRRRGLYRLTATPSFKGVQGAPSRVAFRILG
ncbi:MAG: choice-of-anchor Q domain-containing protein [Solirubrobacteraceae bacterium]